MKAAVCRGFGEDLKIEDVSLAPPGKGQIEVTVAACAICHSDILYAEGAWDGHLPAVYGHEASGRITGLGPAVSGYEVGDRVIVTLLRSCGTCGSCAAGHPTSCEKPYDRVAQSPIRDATGELVEQGMAVGGFAQKVVVDQSQLHKIPDEIAFDAASLLACGVITGMGAVTNAAKVEPGSNVAVVGAGGVGLNAIQGAALSGAARVIAIDLEDEKLEGAMVFGATHAIKAGPKAYKEIKALTGGRGVDYAFVTVGAIRAFQDTLRFLAPRGEMVMVGMPPSGAMAEYEPVVLVALSQVLRGSVMGETVLKRDIPPLTELYKQGRLKLDELITNRYPLDQINQAIADTKAGKSRRNVILFDGADE